MRRSFRRLRNVGTGVAAVLLLASASGLVSQRAAMDLTVDTPVSLTQVADRVRHLDRQQLAGALARAGLNIPPQIHAALFSRPARRRSSPDADCGNYSEPSSGTRKLRQIFRARLLGISV
jgi:hypothetical protein